MSFDNRQSQIDDQWYDDWYDRDDPYRHVYDANLENFYANLENFYANLENFYAGGL